MHIKNIVLLFFGLLYAGFSQAETYKWIDDNGRTNFGDSVPEKYKAKAEKIEIIDKPEKKNEIIFKKVDLYNWNIYTLFLILLI